MLHIPDVLAPEREKYERVWKEPKYKDFSPGLENVERFVTLMEPQAGESLLDIGCGAGVAGLEFEKLDLRVSYLDFTDAGLDPRVNRNRFIEEPIWSRYWRQYRPSFGWDYGFCCDVLEHIPPEYTMLALSRILENCHVSWFQICFDVDLMGQLIGAPLHLTVQPYRWWLGHIASIGKVLDARDLCGIGLFIVEKP